MGVDEQLPTIGVVTHYDAFGMAPVSLLWQQSSHCYKIVGLCYETIFVEEIDHFAAVCSVAWPLNESEAGVDLILIETSLLFLC